MGIIDNEYSEIRNRIFSLLDESGISQKEFAEILQVSPTTITDWKKGKSNSFLRKLEAVSKVLHTTPTWLFSGAGPKHLSDDTCEELIRQKQAKYQEYELELKEHREEPLDLVAESLRNFLIRSGFTESDFERIGCGQAPSAEKAEILARIFGITTPDLATKFASLSSDSQKEVLAFIEFKLSQEKDKE